MGISFGVFCGIAIFYGAALPTQMNGNEAYRVLPEGSSLKIILFRFSSSPHNRFLCVSAGFQLLIITQQQSDKILAQYKPRQ